MLPVYLISRAAKDPHHLENTRLMVRCPGGELVPMVEASQFIAHLPRIDMLRVYARPDLAEGSAAEHIRSVLS